jgi:hypothetical protein
MPLCPLDVMELSIPVESPFPLVLERDLFFRFSRFIKNKDSVVAGYEENAAIGHVRMLVNGKIELVFIFRKPQ